MEPTSLPYQTIPNPPETCRGATVLVRLLDGLGFRYRWATEGLRPTDYEFRAGEGIMSIKEVMEHILFLVERVNQSVGGAAVAGEREASSESPESVRVATLAQILSSRARLLEMSDSDLAARTIEIRPGKVFQIWNMMNGPLADALTHVGQINTWRRMAGNPTPKANVFLGAPPKD